MSRHHSNGRAYRENTKAFREKCESEDAHCWICGLAIDYSIPPERAYEDDAFQRDHYFPASTHPDLYEDVGNWRPSHAGCNRERSNRPPRPALGVLSRRWA